CRLATRLREGAVSAAASLVHGWDLPLPERRRHLAVASGTLREVGYLVDLARRLRYIGLGTAQELLELQTVARLELDTLLRGRDNGEAPATPGAPAPLTAVAT
ncbi:MAG TPA: hypothetical protein VEG34_17075, partial [Thermoanaerobaculia bacterium]|nr:hypothetical protein [Thermoanaerobaculia bacterium]